MPTPPYIARLRSFVGQDLLLVPAAVALIFDDDGRLLLTRRADDGLWGLPGGISDPGEAPATTVVRELAEELGLTVVPEQIAGILGGEQFRHTFPNGDRLEFTIVFFVCRIVTGELSMLDGEVTEVAYFDADQLPPMVAEYPRELLHPSIRARPTYFQRGGS